MTKFIIICSIATIAALALDTPEPANGDPALKGLLFKDTLPHYKPPPASEEFKPFASLPRYRSAPPAIVSELGDLSHELWKYGDPYGNGELAVTPHQRSLVIYRLKFN